MPIYIDLHSDKQRQAFFSKKKITLCCTGIQWGKTTIGAWRMKVKIHDHMAHDDAFIITAPTYKILNQSTLPAFLKIMDGLGEYNKSEACFYVRNGGKVYMRTGHEPDSVVGITNVRHVWADEAGKYSLYFWENIQGRASFKDCQIDLTTSPYTLNWVYKELVKPTLKEKRDDVLLIQARSNENPYFPQEEYERRQKTMDTRRFNAMYGGNFERMAGLVYDCFDEDENQLEPIELPTGTRFVAGIDWGYTEPFVLTVRAITPEKYHYQVSESYKSGLTINDIVALCKQKKQVWNIERFYCGPDQPASIEELNRNGLVALASINDIRLGIDRHYELIKTRRFKIFHGTSPYSLDEYDTYHYPDPDDLRPDQDSKEQNPVGQNDHALDSARYISVMTYKGYERHTPKIAGAEKKETQFDRLERLKRQRAGGGRQYEKWS